MQAVPQAAGRLLHRGHGLLPVRVPRRAGRRRGLHHDAGRALRAPHAARRVPHALAHGPARRVAHARGAAAFAAATAAPATAAAAAGCAARRAGVGARLPRVRRAQLWQRLRSGL